VGLADFVELLKKRLNPCKSSNSQKKRGFLPPANPHLYAQHSAYGTEYFRWPSWPSYLAVLPPSSSTPARWLNLRNCKEVLDFLATAKPVSVTNILLILKPKHSTYWEEN